MTTKEALVQLALGTLSHDYKCKLTENKRTSKKVLEVLSRDKDMWIRWDVADNPNTPVEILEALSKDKDRDFRCRVAINKNTPIEVLKELSKDKDWWIRRNVADTLKYRR